MTGKLFLDFLVGATGQVGILDKNTSDTSYRSFMLQCLNLVAKDIQNRQKTWHWKFLENTATANTVANQHTYDPPDGSGTAPAIDTTKIFAIYDRTSDLTYNYVPYDKFVRSVADPSNNTGDSVMWTFWANTFRLYPVPSSVKTIYLDYIQLLTAWGDSATSNEIPAKYDPVIIDGALVYAYKFDQELGDWRSQQQVYEAGIELMISDNRSEIANLSKTTSHRDRYSGNIDSINSMILPINKTF